MATPAPNPIPEGMNTITPHLWFNGNCKEAIDFYQKAFGAEPIGSVVESPDAKSIMHAMLKWGDSNFMLADTWPDQWEQGPRENSSRRIVGLRG